jgi:hypothetical protein
MSTMRNLLTIKYNTYHRALPITLCILIGLLIYHWVCRGLDAEQIYGDLRDVLIIATAYLEDNPEWPKSWEDLERANVPLHSHVGGSPALHREFEDWKKRIHFDFSLTRAEVATMTLENFTAIRPMGSCWPPEEHIKNLLEIAHQDDGCSVLEVLTIYLRKHAEWPKSWTHLKDVRLPLKSGSGFYVGLDCLDEWKKRVVIDFGLTRGQVGAMTVQNFNAVKPIHPVYGPRQQLIKELLQVARQEPKMPEGQ